MTTFIVGTSSGHNITVEHHTEEQAKEAFNNLNKKQ